MPKNPDVEMLIAIAEKLKSDSTKVYEETVSDLISLNALLLSSWAQSYITSAFSPTVIAITCCHCKMWSAVWTTSFKGGLKNMDVL